MWVANRVSSDYSIYAVNVCTSMTRAKVTDQDFSSGKSRIVARHDHKFMCCGNNPTMHIIYTFWVLLVVDILNSVSMMSDSFPFCLGSHILWKVINGTVLCTACDEILMDTQNHRSGNWAW